MATAGLGRHCSHWYSAKYKIALEAELWSSYDARDGRNFNGIPELWSLFVPKVARLVGQQETGPFPSPLNCLEATYTIRNMSFALARMDYCVAPAERAYRRWR